MFLHNELLVSGEHLYNDKSSKNSFITRLDPQIKIKNQKQKKVNLSSKSQEGKYQNGDHTKLNHVKYSKKKKKFLPPDTHTCGYQGVRNA